MNAESLIPASWFYRVDSQKTMLNWFLYEYALKFYDHIADSRAKALLKWKARLANERLAEFCAYYSKRMRLSILDSIEGDTGATAVYDEYITDYLHAISRSENEAIRKIAGAAWGELLSNCAICPCRCLSRRSERCEFFDRMERGGYLS